MTKHLVALVAIVLSLLAAGCGGQGDTNAKSDETVCVFDGSERGSQKLKKQLFPGEEAYNTDGNDVSIAIPLNNRFYSNNYIIGGNDPGAPEFYTGYVKDNVAMQVQGQFRFKFLAENACLWYEKHGRRNDQGEGMQFNARGEAAAFAPWLVWLNENFGTVATAVVKADSVGFTWPELAYGRDVEAPKRGEPADIAYGKVIGRSFTERLNRSLGGQFFCGDPAQWDEDDGVDAACPPIFFELGTARTVNAQLMTNRQQTEALRESLENQQEQARIRRNNEANAKTAHDLAKEQKQREIELARLAALADPELQKCLVLADKGLDCEGHHPTVVAGR